MCQIASVAALRIALLQRGCRDGAHVAPQASVPPSCGASWRPAHVSSSQISTRPRLRRRRASSASAPSSCTATSRALPPLHRDPARVHITSHATTGARPGQLLTSLHLLEGISAWPAFLPRNASLLPPESAQSAPVDGRQEESVAKVVDDTVARFGTLNTFVRLQARSRAALICGLHCSTHRA